jgi:hypothetical protein
LFAFLSGEFISKTWGRKHCIRPLASMFEE